ncbi:MAG: thioredoxin fold domain-containing protein [candidate division Zixibacteria bacterium]|nr:thioredoxin fold domain-containing protein [candidate division Zixibacteria bacterium]
MPVMKMVSIVLLSVFLLFPALLLADQTDHKKQNPKDVPVDTTAVTWMSYDTGMALAQETGKHVMVNFTTKWCGYCKKMNQTTFVDPEVIRYLNRHFVSIKVDGDSPRELDVNGYKISEKNLARAEYRVTGYPTYWFLKSGGDKIGPAPGYKSSDQMLDLLSFVKDDLYDAMSFSDYVKKGGYKSQKEKP